MLFTKYWMMSITERDEDMYKSAVSREERITVRRCEVWRARVGGSSAQNIIISLSQCVVLYIFLRAIPDFIL